MKKSLHEITLEVGALRVLDAIITKFQKLNGNIIITRKEWVELCKPYLNKSK